MLKIYDISLNGVVSPRFVPVGEGALSLGWKLESDCSGVLQTGYAITLEDPHGHCIWSSGQITSSECFQIPLEAELEENSDYLVRIAVSVANGEQAEDEFFFSTALKAPTAHFLKPRRHVEGWAPCLQTCFSLNGEVSRAVLYVCGLGCGEYRINGQKISDALIDPPQSNYEKEIYYRAYDILPYLAPENTFAALLGEGWYAQSRVWGPLDYKYGDVTLWARLELVYTDGRRDKIETDSPENWCAVYSPIVLNNLYGGETYDARLETDGMWDRKAEAPREAVVRDTTPQGRLKFCEIPPVVVLKELPALTVRQLSGRNAGAWIIDFGENIAGFAEFHLPPSPPGAQYVFRFAETIHPDGALDFRSAGTFATQCLQQDIYICKGSPEGEVYCPRFTYHAFRYAEISGCYYHTDYGKSPGTDIAVARQISTDLLSVGEFSTDNPDINRLHKVILSTLRSNYHGHPEDCPGREKCGWLGDAQIVCETGIMNFSMEAPYLKYLSDIRTQREVYGQWQMIAPGKRGCGEATPLWGAAQILLPYNLYKYYGNRRVITDNWDLMTAWLEHEKADAKDYIITRGLGDWCPPVGSSSPRRFPVPESSTAMFYEIACKMAELAREFSLPGEEEYTLLTQNIKEAFISRFFLPEKGRYSTWGTNGMALRLGLYPEGGYASLLEATVAQIREEDYAMSTGICGNKYLIPLLAENGFEKEAREILFNRRHTSFGTMLDQGATSLFEGLDATLVGAPRNEEVPSYNHPMHAGFAYYFYETLAGIRPLRPGYSLFEIRPCPSDLGYIHAVRETPCGKIEVEIRCSFGNRRISFSVPANTICRFAGKEYGSGRYEFSLGDK